MLWYEAGALMIGTVLVLLALAVPVAFAFMATSALGVLVFIGGDVGLRQLAANSSAAITSFALVPVPLFLLMGELFFHTGIAVRVFDAFDKLFGRVPGRLSYVTVAGGTVFATLSGSSMGNTALLGSSMVPEMTRRGYKPKMSLGPILGTGGLAIIIPPSALAVLLGSLAKIDIGQLLIAGVLPGLLLATLYGITIYTQVKLDPAAAPQYDVPRVGWGEKLRLIVFNLLPMGSIIFLVIGLMMLGWATPTESAAFGALGVLILAAILRKLTWDSLVRAFTGTVKTTAMVFLIITASSTFSQLLALSGATSGLVAWSAQLGLGPMAMLSIMVLILLFMGCMMEQVSIMMLTVPLFFPLALTLGFDPVWFGMIFMMTMEIGLITPPFGLGLYVLLGVSPPGTSFLSIVTSAIPYIACALFVILAIILVPGLALWLPNLLN